MYEVEEILNSRLYRDKLQYLIKWKDYLPSENKWVPATNVQAKRLINAFHRKNPSAVRVVEVRRGAAP